MLLYPSCVIVLKIIKASTSFYTNPPPPKKKNLKMCALLEVHLIPRAHLFCTSLLGKLNIEG